MRIATEAQRTEAMGADGTGWDTSVIAREELFNVPKEI